MSRIFFMSPFGTLCEACFCYKGRRTYVLLRGLTRVIWPACFSVSWAVSQDSMRVWVYVVVWKERVWRGYSIAIGPNKHCTVEPCGSTDSFYRSHKGTYGKLRTCLHQSGKTWLVLSGFKLFQLKCGWAGFYLYSQRHNFVSTCRRANFDSKTTLELFAP